MTEYKSLLEVMRPYLNIRVIDIPEELRERIKEADHFSLWDLITPWQREQLLYQYDCTHDPELTKQVDRGYQTYRKEKEIEELESMPAINPLQRESKISQLKALNAELEALKSNYLSNCSSQEQQSRIPISEQQEAAILDAIRKKGYEPLNLPKPISGLAGIKKEIRDEFVPSGLFCSKRVFNDRWQALRDDGKIKDAI